MWQDIKKAIYVQPPKKVIGNLEYELRESPELVVKTLYIIMKDRA